MDGFSKLPKMAHFKEGGHAKKEAYCSGGKAYKKGGEVTDEKQDKALIKKAFKQHDEAEHDKEPTEIKLRKGGRASKKEGSVRKFKTGGSVTNVYEAKKSSGDLDNIKKTKDIKPGKASAPSKAKEKPSFKGSDVEKEKSKPAGHKDSYLKSKESSKSADAPSGAKDGVNKYKTGGGVKKMADGRSVSDDLVRATMDAKLAAAEVNRQKMKDQAASVLSPSQRAELAAQQAQATQQYGGGAQMGGLGATGTTPAGRKSGGRMCK